MNLHCMYTFSGQLQLKISNLDNLVCMLSSVNEVHCTCNLFYLILTAINVEIPAEVINRKEKPSVHKVS